MGTITRVGVLEDDPVLASVVVSKLQNADYQVDLVAGNLKEGEQLFLSPPDVALMDLALPDGDAFDLIARLTAETDTTILVLSALDDAKSVLKAFHCGAAGYVLKDAQGFEIVDAISHALRGDPPVSPAIARYLLQSFKPVSPLRRLRREQFLSKREREVLVCVANGQTRKEVARQLNISPYTVAEYLSNIYRKYKVSNKSAAVARAIENRDI